MSDRKFSQDVIIAIIRKQLITTLRKLKKYNIQGGSVMCVRT